MKNIALIVSCISCVALMLLWCCPVRAAYPIIYDGRATAEYWLTRCPDVENVLADAAEIACINAAMRSKNVSLYDLKNMCGSIDGGTLQWMISAAMEDYADMQRPDEYYQGQWLTSGQWGALLANLNLHAVPATVQPRFAVTIRRANVRLLPTDSGLYAGASELSTHYDSLQATALDPAEPVLIFHQSADGLFDFVAVRNYLGWVNAASLAVVSEDEWLRYAAPQEFYVVTDNKKVIATSHGPALFQMGAVLPSAAGANANEFANMPKDFLPFTRANIIRQSFKFLGDVYGWGGQDNSVDCSAFVADVYRSVGVELPRNADTQELAMPVSINLRGLSHAQRLAALRNVPAGALLFKPGHVLLFLGFDDGSEPVAIHAISSCYVGGEKVYLRQVVVSSLNDVITASGQCMLDTLTSAGYCR